jgi:hypothetical protein
LLPVFAVAGEDLIEPWEERVVAMIDSEKMMSL